MKKCEMNKILKAINEDKNFLSENSQQSMKDVENTLQKNLKKDISDSS